MKTGPAGQYSLGDTRVRQHRGVKETKGVRWRGRPTPGRLSARGKSSLTSSQKLAMAEEETDETCSWLELIFQAELLPASKDGEKLGMRIKE